MLLASTAAVGTGVAGTTVAEWVHNSHAQRLPTTRAAAPVLPAAAFPMTPACPCANVSACTRISGAAEREVFAFHVATAGDVWQGYDWGQVTTVAVFGTLDPALLCAAHERGARVVMGVSFPNDQLPNATAVGAWVAAQAAFMAGAWTDGVNIDIEGNTANADALTALVVATGAAVRGVWPDAQLTFDTAIMPAWVTGGYNMTALAAACDFLVPMGYDMCWGAAVAAANAPLPGVVAGMTQYTDLYGVPPSKLVLGVPWYGYDFPCLNAPTPAAPTCHVNGTFSGAWSYSFAAMLSMLGPAPPVYNATQASPYFTYQDAATGEWHQLWYDDELSLSWKYEAAAAAGARGIAMWTADFLDYASGTRVATMWDALRANFTAAPSPSMG